MYAVFVRERGNAADVSFPQKTQRMNGFVRTFLPLKKITSVSRLFSSSASCRVCLREAGKNVLKRSTWGTVVFYVSNCRGKVVGTKICTCRYFVCRTMSSELLILSRMYSLSARGRERGGGRRKGEGDGEGKWEEFARKFAGSLQYYIPVGRLSVSVSHTSRGSHSFPLVLSTLGRVTRLDKGIPVIHFRGFRSNGSRHALSVVCGLIRRSPTWAGFTSIALLVLFI